MMRQPQNQCQGWTPSLYDGAHVITRGLGRGGPPVPVIGQGTWHMGENSRARDQEIAALRLGLDLGLTHIDTAEIYADGRAEEIVGEAIADRRADVVIATKVKPSHASYEGTLRAFEASLKRLRTTYIDLYLLHWWGNQHPIAETMRAMETLVERGLLRGIGVSNFDVPQLEAAQAALKRERILCNQVLYHLGDRSVEAAVLPYCERTGIALVGYTPLARGGFLRGAVEEIARKHGRTPRQVALNFLTRRPALFTIPKAAQLAHVRENAAALDFTLTGEEIAAIDRAFKGPRLRA
jgi:diketogulonate reductase-like aldo/keto reductase